jgi:galactokinase
MNTPQNLPNKEFDLPERLIKQTETFTTLFGVPPTTISRAPGRAEILGCHTDYNWGYALAAGITRSTIALLSKREDTTFCVYSNSFPQDTPIQFSMDSLTRDETVKWPNYVKAVIRELLSQGFAIGGAILIDSTVPNRGDVPQLELAVAYGLLALHNHQIDVTSTALLCKTAENSDLVQSPCGFLDQGASAFAKDNAIVFMDFLPSGSSPVSAIDVIPARFETPCTFVIPVDPHWNVNWESQGMWYDESSARKAGHFGLAHWAGNQKPKRRNL